MASLPDGVAERHAASVRGRRPVRVTLRELRDELGRQSLGAATRVELAEALARAGLQARPPLNERGLGLDDPIELRRRRFRRVRAIGGRSFSAAQKAMFVLGSVLTVAAVAGIIGGWFSSPAAPRPMSGDFNVLVTPFAASGTAERRDGAALAETTARALLDGLESAQPTDLGGIPLDVQVRGPAGVGVVGGRTAAQRSTSAVRLANAHDADVVVFGAVVAGADRSRVVPGVYVRAAKLPDADELAGEYRLATVVDSAGSVNDAIVRRQQLRLAFLRRVDGLRALVNGLADFQARDWASARERFAAAAAAEPDAPTTAFVRLFEGNAAGKLGDLDGAERAYRRALAEQPTLLRAAVGLAEAGFQRAHRGCEAGVTRAAGLRRVEAAFRKVLRQVHRNVPLVVAVRGHFGRGRVLMCLSQAELAGSWQEAERELRRTLALADDADPARFRNERAEAHAGLGLIALPAAGTGDDGVARRSSYKRARAQYEQAAEISDDPARKAVFLEMIAFVHGRLGEREAAAHARARARALTHPGHGSKTP